VALVVRRVGLLVGLARHGRDSTECRSIPTAQKNAPELVLIEVETSHCDWSTEARLSTTWRSAPEPICAGLRLRVGHGGTAACSLYRLDRLSCCAVGWRRQSRREFASAVSATRTGDAALSKSDDASEVQLSSCPGAQPIQSGAPSRYEASLQAETLCGLGRVARSRGVDRRARGSSRAARRRASVTLTPPHGDSRFHDHRHGPGARPRREIPPAAPTGETLERLKGVVPSHLGRFAFREAPLPFNWSAREG
jgi:hypothetical protein